MMRVFIGSALAAVVAVAGLLGSIAQSVVIAHSAQNSPVTEIAADRTGPLLAARRGGPTVYGWLYASSPRDETRAIISSDDPR